jgi:hypothetical protein
MKKFKLDLDDLRVESFATTPEPTAQGGTVFGYETTIEITCATCAGCETGTNATDGCNTQCGGTEYTVCWGECGGATQDLQCSANCFTVRYDCTWHPEDQRCGTNPIAYPTWPCDQNNCVP